jgi:predicted type IV restriction endonuclease
MAHYGNASIGYLITLSGKHVTVRSDYAIVRKGGVILALLEGNYSSVSLTQFQGFLTKAVTKVK